MIVNSLYFIFFIFGEEFGRLGHLKINIQDLDFAGLPGLEPRLFELETKVLPITPQTYSFGEKGINRY